MSPDALGEFSVSAPAGMAIASATQVDAGGRRTAARVDKGRIRLEQPLRQWEFAVLA